MHTDSHAQRQEAHDREDGEAGVHRSAEVGDRHEHRVEVAVVLEAVVRSERDERTARHAERVERLWIEDFIVMTLGSVFSKRLKVLFGYMMKFNMLFASGRSV